jgi:hypothetical protein
MECQPDLLEIVAARRAARRLTSCLHGRQQEPDEHADDGYHDQQFDKRKTVTNVPHSVPGAHLRWIHATPLEKPGKSEDH